MIFWDEQVNTPPAEALAPGGVVFWVIETVDTDDVQTPEVTTKE